jgi:hypothetical protein
MDAPSCSADGCSPRRAHFASCAAIRANAEAEAAQRREAREHASQQQVLSDSHQAMRDAYRERETVFAAVMADRAEWDKATRHQRHLAADAELRRRLPPSSSRRCAQPNRSRPPRPSATSSPSPPESRSPRPARREAAS